MPFPTRRTFAALAALVGLFVVWMSLIPFNFRAVRSVAEHIVGIGRPLPEHLSRSDFIANAVVFVAIGFLGAGALALDRPSRARRWLAFAAVVGASAALGAAVEVAQVFLPWRVSSVVDVGAQTAGSLAGVLLFGLVGQLLADAVRQGTRRHHPPSGVVTLLLVYALGYVAFRLFPYAFTVSPGEIAFKLRSGLVGVMPFQTVPASPEGLAHLLERCLSAIPLGALAVLAGVPAGRRRSLPAAVAWTALFLAGLEVLKLLSVFHYADTGNVIVGTAGAAVGALLASRHSGRPVVRPRHASRWHWPALACCVLLAAWYEWYPWNFDTSRRGIADGIQRASLVLFASHQLGTPEAALADLVGQVLVAAPLGLVGGLALARRHPAWPNRLRLALVVSGSAAVFSVLEAGQVMLPGRTPDVTDILVPTLAAAASAWLVCRRRPMA